MTNNEYTDRYEAIGMPPPDPETMCSGQCEGIGVVPVYEDDEDEVYRTLWQKAEAKQHADDRCHFVKCPECNGTGKDLTKCQ